MERGWSMGRLAAQKLGCFGYTRRQRNASKATQRLNLLNLLDDVLNAGNIEFYEL